MRATEELYEKQIINSNKQLELFSVLAQDYFLPFQKSLHENYSKLLEIVCQIGNTMTQIP